MSKEIFSRWQDPTIEKLQQENQQLKEKYLGAVADYETTKSENQQLKESYCNRTDCSGRLHDSRKYPSVKQQLDLYKSILDEIRECIKELDDNTDDTICYDIDRNVRDNLLQILDKVKE